MTVEIITKNGTSYISRIDTKDDFYSYFDNLYHYNGGEDYLILDDLIIHKKAVEVIRLVRKGEE